MRRALFHRRLDASHFDESRRAIVKGKCASMLVQWSMDLYIAKCILVRACDTPHSDVLDQPTCIRMHGPKSAKTREHKTLPKEPLFIVDEEVTPWYCLRRVLGRCSRKTRPVVLIATLFSIQIRLKFSLIGSLNEMKLKTSSSMYMMSRWNRVTNMQSKKSP